MKKSASGVEEALLIRLGAKSGSDTADDAEPAGETKEAGEAKGGKP